MKSSDTRKVVIIGTGMVGMSCAYALLNQSAVGELVLIDINKERAAGEAMDLQHGLAFAPGSMKIYAGDYSDCNDADIVMIAAGVAQRPDESRLDLLQRNADVFMQIVPPVVQSGFDGIFLVATNPVDIMTHIVYDLSGFPASKVIGSGTTLDTARLRYLIGRHFSLNPKNVHAYVIGEHGDSEFVPWSQAFLATKPILDVAPRATATSRDDRDTHAGRFEDMLKISEEVRTSAQVIIAAKKATYYGIGMALTRIILSIFDDENSVLTVSSMLNGEYGQKNVYVGVPSIVSRSGVRRILRINLSDDEMRLLNKSCTTLRESYQDIKLKNMV